MHEREGGVDFLVNIRPAVLGLFDSGEGFQAADDGNDSLASGLIDAADVFEHVEDARHLALYILPFLPYWLGCVVEDLPEFFERAHHEVAVRVDRAHRGIDLVCHTGDEVSEARHFLRLNEGGLGQEEARRGCS